MAQAAGDKGKPMHVTTETGRILRVDASALQALAEDAEVAAAPKFADPARREDVLFRVRRDHGHEPSAWWMIGAFLVTSALAVLLLGWVPGGA